MIEVRPFETLGKASHGWLEARHHFAFGSYRDPARQGWGDLAVWNDDAIAPGTGFPPHPHKDMEIITYVREGAITHEDSLGNRGSTAAGDVQVMSAGSGIRHSEYNLEPVETRLFQIWIQSARPGAAPAWGSKPFPHHARSGCFVTLASGMGDAGALPIQAQARVAGASLKAGETAEWRTEAGRHVYLVASSGELEVNGVPARARDGVAITGETLVQVRAASDAELVLVDAA